MLALSRVADAADGADPLSEHVSLRLRDPGTAPSTHLTSYEPDGTLVGYAFLEVVDGEASAELVVHPMHRRRGLGRALVEATVAATVSAGRPGAAPVPGGGLTAEPTDAGTGTTADRLLIWAHSDHPAAAALALDLGFDRARVLWQLRRSLRGPLPAPALPDGVSLRTFRPGADDEAWLALNRRAFAEHPEQGRWTQDDLRLRMAEPWFDPAGFLLAVDDATGRLLGFHWTKVHSGGTPIGEVYVVGVDPDAHGRGLGRALTLAGLHHLRDRGLTRVMLYVDESNTAAMRLYTRLGFANWLRHVRYRWIGAEAGQLAEPADRMTAGEQSRDAA